jgi:hypothetical protein
MGRANIGIVEQVSGGIVIRRVGRRGVDASRAMSSVGEAYEDPVIHYNHC